MTRSYPLANAALQYACPTVRVTAYPMGLRSVLRIWLLFYFILFYFSCCAESSGNGRRIKKIQQLFLGVGVSHTNIEQNGATREEPLCILPLQAVIMGIKVNNSKQSLFFAFPGLEANTRRQWWLGRCQAEGGPWKAIVRKKLM